VTVRPSAAVRTGSGLARFAAGLLFALPIAAALPLALNEGLSAGAWHALLDDPQLPRALALSVGSALASTVAAVALTLWIVTHLLSTMSSA